MPSIFDFQKLEDFRKKHRFQPFRIKQIYNNIFKNSIIDFDQMTDLPKDLRKKLKNEFYIVSLQPEKVLDSYNTTKISFKNLKGYTFETVLMYHYHEKNNQKKLNRITICLSSQIGCAVWCKFCVTWKLWFIDNLTSFEILEQIIWANYYVKNKFWKKEDWTWHKVRNVVFMWMWEPFLNYENVKKSILMMLDQKKLSLSKRHITISTSWIVPWIKKMIKDNLNVRLAVSLHSADEKTRKEIMPITQRYSLNELMNVLDEYVMKTKNRVFYEYILIEDLTDTPYQAKKLVLLLKNRLAHVNLIPYNENPAVDYKTPSLSRILAFKKILEDWWLTVTIRTPMWEEIKWACWQLGYEKVKNST